jgi:hypothetical protein
MGKHKQHVFLSGHDIDKLQSQIKRGVHKRIIAKRFGICLSSVYKFDPDSKIYEPNLIRVRKSKITAVVSDNTSLSDNTSDIRFVDGDIGFMLKIKNFILALGR